MATKRRTWRMGWNQRKKSPPKKWKKISTFLKFIFASSITIFSGTPLIANKTSDILSLCFSLGIMVLTGFDIILGPDEDLEPAAVPTVSYRGNYKSKKKDEPSDDSNDEETGEVH